MKTSYIAIVKGKELVKCGSYQDLVAYMFAYLPKTKYIVLKG